MSRVLNHVVLNLAKRYGVLWQLLMYVHGGQIFPNKCTVWSSISTTVNSLPVSGKRQPTCEMLVWQFWHNFAFCTSPNTCRLFVWQVMMWSCYYISTYWLLSVVPLLNRLFRPHHPLTSRYHSGYTKTYKKHDKKKYKNSFHIHLYYTVGRTSPGLDRVTVGVM